jgi:NDP-sugar pyrophosphorylase family protein
MSSNGIPKTPRKAVILAGGKGSRLAPYTTVLPKPLLPIGDRAILDVVVRQLKNHGFSDMTFAVGYLAHLIQAVFGDGSEHGVSIQYHREQSPLGTAGALSALDDLNDTFLFMNGDVLTTLDYNGLYELHRESGNVLTIASHRRVVQTDYGVIHTDGDAGETQLVTAYDEKPAMPFLVSMGVYIAEPAILDYIPTDTHFDMPEVVLRLIEAGEQVGSSLYDGFWLDIGRHADYEQAIREYEGLLPALYRVPEEHPSPAVPKAPKLRALPSERAAG